jgi:hypothetical protein
MRRSAADGFEALRTALAAEGGTVATLLDGSAAPPNGAIAPGPAQIAASGPRAAGQEAEYELLLEMIIEGSRLHYGPRRIVLTDDDDLALLLGDQLYALGLARLAALGDVEAVTELGDVISLVAQAQAAADGELVDAIWHAGAVAVGWGGSEQHSAAKALARAGEPRAAAALRGAAEGRTS